MMTRRAHRRMIALMAFGALLLTGLASVVESSSAADDDESTAKIPTPAVIPAPVSMVATPGHFRIGPETSIAVNGPARAVEVGDFLAELLRPATGYPLPVVSADSGAAATQSISLQVTTDGELTGEAYRLDVSPGAVVLRAGTPEGLFRGVQTLRQLLPAKVEHDSVQSGPWELGGVHIADHPRYKWRGGHLDVARHFLTVDEVKRYIDLLALYKVNRFHLHLADDQGWRIQIDSWPDLTRIGGATEVGGGPGGFYTKDDYGDIVDYAADRFITVIPEIDMPGHTDAAETSYPKLNSCRTDNLPSHRFLEGWEDAPHYTGTGVGFSTLCVHDPVTYEFLGDVIGELAAMTPGPYLHVGGDEAHSTDEADYVLFMDKVRDIVQANDKTLMGWAEVAQANPLPGSIAQNWTTATGSESGGDLARTAVAKDMKVVMSPANRIYLDMKYAPGVPPDLGLSWAGFVEVKKSYDWNPGAHLTGVTDANVLGVEAALWSETVTNIDDAEVLAYPRMAGAAEIGWTPQAGRSWDDYRLRLAAQAERWEVLGVDFYRSPQVPWPE
ncbi:MAG TPA: beta-N-acetylhexosaminidase [Nocardioidaceae bacterium]|nr:beta-N-acetylhexosaminidase [Nocardioidaceae bacterium]